MLILESGLLIETEPKLAKADYGVDNLLHAALEHILSDIERFLGIIR